jgi:hypothetical protein
MSTKRYQITESEKKQLQRLFRTLFRQSFHHKQNITDVYSLMREAYENEFTEDNKATADHFLTECFSKSTELPNE